LISLFYSITALFASLIILLTGHGFQLTIAPLYALELGWSPETIGYIGSAYFLGFVAGCVGIPHLVTRVGHIRVFSVLAASATMALLLIGLLDSMVGWLVARFITGIAISGLYMVIESWLNERSTAANRGLLLSIYTILTLGAICLGQLLIGLPLDWPQKIMLAAVLLAAGAIPVGLTRSTAPAPIPAVGMKLAEVYRASHVAVIGALVGGAVTAGYWTMGPVVAQSMNLGLDQVGVFLASALLGGALMQLPLGRLSDRIDRRLVILGVAVAGVANCVVAVLTASAVPWLVFVFMFLFGGTAFPLYSLCLAHANDNTELSLIEVGSVILLANSLGAVLGPIFMARAMEYHAYGMFLVAGALLAVFSIWTAWRLKVHPVTRSHFEPYVDAPKTSLEIINVLHPPKTRTPNIDEDTQT
jgi:MFS family permease